MTQENKELLLKDLCARLPYEVRLHISSDLVDKDDALLGISLIEGLTPYITHDKIIAVHSGYSYSLKEVKPYLRPLSSMTEEEAMEYANCGNIIANSPQNNYLIPNPNCVDWLNAHHFDYRGLIEKGLALEALEGMYEY